MESFGAQGRPRGRNVFQYLYSQNGRVFSLTRWGNQRVQIEIPAGCGIIPDHVKAFEGGMTLHKFDIGQ